MQEHDEERRILYELSAQIGEHREELIYGVENLAMLDLIFAKAKYAEELKASEPVLHKLSAVSNQRSAKNEKQELKAESRTLIRLLRARHPLLDPNTVVPIDVDPKPGTARLLSQARTQVVKRFH